MNLSFYNVLSHLISGFLVYIVGLHVLNLEPDYLDPLIATAVAYILGYIINSVSAWIEGFLNWTWRGRPSDQILKGGRCMSIGFSEHAKIHLLLQKRHGGENPTTDDLFKVAMRIANNEGRIPEMSGQYAFSRSFFIASIISLIMLGFELYINWIFWVISVLLILIVWYRTKECGYYYVKEVLNVALNKLERE